MFGSGVKDDDEVMLLLEIQYLSILELMTETGEFPTRDEVVKRAELMIKQANNPNVIQLN